jgi:hypothetical protein
MHICLSMDPQIPMSEVTRVCDICALGRLLGMRYNSAEEPYDD